VLTRTISCVASSINLAASSQCFSNSGSCFPGVCSSIHTYRRQHKTRATTEESGGPTKAHFISSDSCCSQSGQWVSEKVIHQKSRLAFDTGSSVLTIHNNKAATSLGPSRRTTVSQRSIPREHFPSSEIALKRYIHFPRLRDIFTRQTITFPFSLYQVRQGKRTQQITRRIYDSPFVSKGITLKLLPHSVRT